MSTQKVTLDMRGQLMPQIYSKLGPYNVTSDIKNIARSSQAFGGSITLTVPDPAAGLIRHLEALAEELPAEQAARLGELVADYCAGKLT